MGGFHARDQCNTRWYTWFVPTTRRRHPITETPEITEILDEASRRWGELSRGKLIKLILHDWAAGGRAPSARAAARRALEGSMPETSAAYDRSEDWPA